jgi:hypothetical protein
VTRLMGGFNSLWLATSLTLATRRGKLSEWTDFMDRAKKNISSVAFQFSLAFHHRDRRRSRAASSLRSVSELHQK